GERQGVLDSDPGGDLRLECVDMRPERCDPAGAHRIEEVLLLNAGDISLGQVDARHQTPACIDFAECADCRHIQSAAIWSLSTASDLTSSTPSVGTSTLETSGLVVARRFSQDEKRSSPSFSPGRRPV